MHQRIWIPAATRQSTAILLRNGVVALNLMPTVCKRSPSPESLSLSLVVLKDPGADGTSLVRWRAVIDCRLHVACRC